MADHPSDETFRRALKHRGAVMAVIVALVRDFDTAEDLFQETMLEIVRSEGRFNEERDFVRWAKGIARNVALRHVRQRSRQPVSLDHSILEFVADTITEDEPESVWDEERRGLRHCLKRLPARQRRLFQLRYGENLKGEALAQEADVKPGSVRTTLLRIRALLRSCIDAYVRGVAFEGGRPR